MDNQNIQPIPGTWEIAKLENVVEILDSQRVPVNAKERALREGNIPYYGATGQVGWIDDYLFNEEIILLGEDGAPFLDPFKQKAFVVSGKSWVNNHAHVLRSLGGVLNSFVCNYLNMFDFHGYVTGTTRLKLNQTRMRQIPIPLAPVSEQKRIVAEIEKQFSRLDKAVENLKQVEANLKRYKASVLKAAVEGKLTEEWRKANPDVEPADKLLERILIERRKKWEAAELAKMEAKGKVPKNDKWKKKYKEPYGPKIDNAQKLPDRWVWGTFEQVSVRVTVGHVGSMIKEYRDTGIPFLRSQNVRENEYSPIGLKYIRREFHEKLEKSALKPGDIVVVRSGSVGISCVIPENLPEANCSDLIIIKEPLGIESEYGSYYMNSITKTLVASETVGMALTHFNTQSAATMPIPVPPYEEQIVIVKELKRCFSIAKKVESEVERMLEKTVATKQAILKKAFTGKLVPQDPNDEPASVLLQKIKDEISELKKAPKKRKQKKKGGKVAKKIQSLVEVLKQFDEPITPETLFEASGYSIDTIDEFYEKLKEEVDILRTIEELRPDDANVFLKLVS